MTIANGLAGSGHVNAHLLRSCIWGRNNSIYAYKSLCLTYIRMYYTHEHNTVVSHLGSMPRHEQTKIQPNSSTKTDSEYKIVIFDRIWLGFIFISVRLKMLLFFMACPSKAIVR
jgi:hypothetical protein